MPWVFNLRDIVPGLAWLSERIAGFDRRRSLPKWRAPFSRHPRSETCAGREAVLWIDTFNRYFEPETVAAACEVLAAAGVAVTLVDAADGKRPLCCGRTFLSAGLVEEAQWEARRTADALLPFARRGIPILGLEPSCLFTFRDEFASLLPAEDAASLSKNAMGVIVISTDFEEVAAICHRAIVFSRGQVISDLSGVALSTESLIQAASANEATTPSAA